MCGLIMKPICGVLDGIGVATIGIEGKLNVQEREREQRVYECGYVMSCSTEEIIKFETYTEWQTANSLIIYIICFLSDHFHQFVTFLKFTKYITC